MRYVALTEAKSGMQLAKSLYDSNGRTLVGSHIMLTDNYIEKLIAYGYAGAYIEDALTQDIEVEDAISPQLRAEGMGCIERRDIDGCKLGRKAGRRNYVKRTNFFGYAGFAFV